MKIGDYITRLTGAAQYSPPFSRGGQGVNITIDALDVPGGGSQLAVDIEHKNSEDTTWSVLASFAAITTTGLKSEDATGCKEMLRLKYTVSGGGANTYDTFYINVLAPVWRP